MRTCCPSEVVISVSATASVEAPDTLPAFDGIDHLALDAGAAFGDSEFIHNQRRVERGAEGVAGKIAVARKAIRPAGPESWFRLPASRDSALAQAAGRRRFAHRFLDRAGAPFDGRRRRFGTAAGCGSGLGSTSGSGRGGSALARLPAGSGARLSAPASRLAADGLCPLVLRGKGRGCLRPASNRSGGLCGHRRLGAGGSGGVVTASRHGNVCGRNHSGAGHVRVDCHFITSAPPSAPAATNSPICNGFMLQFSVST